MLRNLTWMELNTLIKQTAAKIVDYVRYLIQDLKSFLLFF